jgi:hypothetical protein
MYLISLRHPSRMVKLLLVLCLVGVSAHADRPAESPFGESARSHDNIRYQRATIIPSLIHLDPGETQQFKVVILATRLMAADAPKEVKWAVNDIPGGNAKVGTIDANGVYSTPANMPSPREIHICAEASDVANKFLFGTVIIGDAPLRYKSVHVWAEKPADKGSHLSSPHGIGLDKDENILIADQGKNQVLRFAQDGTFMNQIGEGNGRLPGQLTKPREVRSDVKGRIFVTDSKGDRPRVQVFSNDGKFKRIFGEKGRLPGMLLRAHGMGWDPEQRLFVVDVDNMRVNVYDKDGKPLYDWGTEGTLPGELNAPHGIFVDRSGDVFVSGYYGPTQKFNSKGEYVLTFGHGDPPDGPVYFHSVSGDKWGNAYLSVRSRGGYDGSVQGADEKRISIMKYNNNGDFVASWAYSKAEHSESEVAVGEDGRVYALFTGAGEAGVETFEQE